MMSSEKMILKTSGPECFIPGDYLRFYMQFDLMTFSLPKVLKMLFSWNEMVWNVTGTLEVENISIEEVCLQR